MSWPDVARWILWVLAFVGLPSLIVLTGHTRRFSREHFFFRFQSKEAVDIVLTTSERTPGGVGITYIRPTTSVGNLKGSTEIARAIGNLSRKRSIRVHLSQEIDSRLSGDLVLLGGPNKNEITAICLEYVYQLYPKANLAYIDSKDRGCFLGLGEFAQQYELKLQAARDIPRNDFALVAMWVNPLSPHKRRLIVCAGFTAYGTAAAAQYLVTDFMNERYAKLQRRHGLARLWHPRRWGCFLLALEIRLANDQVVEVRERAFVPLPDPGAPPLALPEIEIDGQIGSVPQGTVGHLPAPALRSYWRLPVAAWAARMISRALSLRAATRR